MCTWYNNNNNCAGRFTLNGRRAYCVFDYWLFLKINYLYERRCANFIDLFALFHLNCNFQVLKNSKIYRTTPRFHKDMSDVMAPTHENYATRNDRHSCGWMKNSSSNRWNPILKVTLPRLNLWIKIKPIIRQ